MRFATLALMLFGAANACALGPIPNGTYVGKVQCSGMGEKDVTLIVSDTMTSWNGQKRDFIIGSSSYFTVFSVEGMAGLGHGYFTPYGMHYDFTIKIPIASLHETIPVPSESTFVYAGGTLYLLSSSGGAGKKKLKCSGAFTPKR